MKMPLAVSLIVGFLLLGLLTLSVPSVRQAIFWSRPMRPVVMQALGDDSDSTQHAKYFLLLIRLHQYADARSLLTIGARKSLSTPALQGQWAAFESVHGRVTHWTDAGSTANLLPDYVDRRYQVSGSRGSMGLVTLRMTRPADSPHSISSWQIDCLTISR